MTAWTQGLSTAPKDRMLMVNMEHWQCPVFVQWEPEDDMHNGFWRFCDELISDASDPLEEEDITEMKWAIVPE